MQTTYPLHLAGSVKKRFAEVHGREARDLRWHGGAGTDAAAWPQIGDEYSDDALLPGVVFRVQNRWIRFTERGDREVHLSVIEWHAASYAD